MIMTSLCAESHYPSWANCDAGLADTGRLLPAQRSETSRLLNFGQGARSPLNSSLREFRRLIRTDLGRSPADHTTNETGNHGKHDKGSYLDHSHCGP